MRLIQVSIPPLPHHDSVHISDQPCLFSTIQIQGPEHHWQHLPHPNHRPLHHLLHPHHHSILFQTRLVQAVLPRAFGIALHPRKRSQLRSHADGIRQVRRSKQWKVVADWT